MDEHFKRIDTSKIAPFFLEKCEQLIKNCMERGAEFWAISGYRDPAEQEKLYAIGRTVEKGHRPVTNARPYTSFHNYGLAIDFCRDLDVDRAGLQPDWKLEDYEVLREEAEKLGLTSGLSFKSFKEGPHVQTPFISGKLSDLEHLMRNGGLQAVWDQVRINLQLPSV